jgi:adenine-specific DNA glycosylase
MSQPPKGHKVVKNLPIKDVGGLQAAMTDWFSREGRQYPWRATEDGYEILVSEIMLQQTQVATVLGRGYYTRWLELFPDVQTLAKADEGSVLRAWEGLGYYSRARNLQKAARHIVEEHGGVFPRSLPQIEALPGVGRYTAGAVARQPLMPISPACWQGCLIFASGLTLHMPASSSWHGRTRWCLIRVAGSGTRH